MNKTIFFDIDETLVNYEQAQVNALKNIKKKYFPKTHSFPLFFTQWNEYTQKNWQRFEKGELTFEEQRLKRVKDTWEFFDKKIKDPKANNVIKEYVSTYESLIKSYPYVFETLRALSKQKYSLGVISNGGYRQQLRKLKKIGVYPLFKKDLIIISEKVGFAKPDLKIFVYAQKQANTLGSSILYFGNDIEKDIIPAEKLGWKTVLVDHKRKYASLPYLRITSFKQVEKLLA